MTYYIDEFVNFTAPEQGRYVDMSADVNTNSSDVLYDEIPRKFSNWFEWDNCIHQAGPSPPLKQGRDLFSLHVTSTPDQGVCLWLSWLSLS